MGTILVLTRKDLRRRLSDPAALLLNLAIPLAIAGAMALTFGHRGGSAEQNAPKLRLAVVNLDTGVVAEMLAGATQNDQAARHMEIAQAATREEGLALLRDKEYAALLIIPKGFGETVLRGGRTRFELIKNPAQNLMPIAAQQIAEVAALYVSGAARLIGEDGPRLQRLFQDDGWRDTPALTSLVSSLSGRVQRVGALLLPPLIEVSEKKDEVGAEGFDFMSWMYPGMVVMGLIFTGMSQMKDLLREKDAGTLRRQFAAPVGAATVLVSKILASGVIVAAALAILMSIGSIALGIHWGAPLPLAAASILLVLAVTGFAALLFAVVRTERQGDAFGGILTMVMSLLGGAFVPVEIMPDWMSRLARVTVNFWGNGALRTLATGGGWAEVAPYLRVLAVLGFSMTLIGVGLLRRRHARGAL